MPSQLVNDTFRLEHLPHIWCPGCGHGILMRDVAQAIENLGLDKDKVNIYGGGISIGHPIGATGAILTVKVLYELLHTDKKDAMISMCIGGGQGISMFFTKCAGV